MAEPTTVVITDSKGVALTNTGGTTGSRIREPIPVVVTGTDGKALTPVKVPQIVASVDATAQAANIGNTTLYAVPTTGAYLICATIAVTQAATTSCTRPSVGVNWNQGDSNVGLGATVLTTSTTNTTASTAQATQIVYAKGGSNITYNTASYASSGATPMQYSLHIQVIKLY